MKNNIEHQYLTLLQDILDDGVLKPAARENMPGTKSLFGYQMRHDLSLGFPLLTTKKMGFKGVVVELLWFLKGDINIKFLDNHGVDYMWHEDAYAYYCKKCKEVDNHTPVSFEEFLELIKSDIHKTNIPGYTLGDCGYQYGKVWRDWTGHATTQRTDNPSGPYPVDSSISIDQIKNVLTSLKNNPEGRRHIVTAVDPTHDTDLALYWCHSMFQFNCRPRTSKEMLNDYYSRLTEEDYKTSIREIINDIDNPKWIWGEIRCEMLDAGVSQYYLDCHLYQRSADTLLGVPCNIASYSLLTMLFTKILNMVPGEFVHSFGDVHLYENHFAAAKEQLEREPKELPKLNINTEFWKTESGECGVGSLSIDGFLDALQDDNFIKCLFEDIQLSNYNPHPKLENETKLSTGIKK